MIGATTCQCGAYRPLLARCPACGSASRGASAQMAGGLASATPEARAVVRHHLSRVATGATATDEAYVASFIETAIRDELVAERCPSIGCVQDVETGLSTCSSCHAAAGGGR